VQTISQGQHSLPRELEECHESIHIVAVWLEDVKRSVQPVSTTVEEDRHLEGAIRQCSQTASEFLVLLESLSHGSLRLRMFHGCERLERPFQHQADGKDTMEG
jgi:hypothetical protein